MIYITILPPHYIFYLMEGGGLNVESSDWWPRAMRWIDFVLSSRLCAHSSSRSRTPNSPPLFWVCKKIVAGVPRGCLLLEDGRSRIESGHCR